MSQSCDLLLSFAGTILEKILTILPSLAWFQILTMIVLFFHVSGLNILVRSLILWWELWRIRSKFLGKSIVSRSSSQDRTTTIFPQMHSKSNSLILVRVWEVWHSITGKWDRFEIPEIVGRIVPLWYFLKSTFCLKFNLYWI